MLLFLEQNGAMSAGQSVVNMRVGSNAAVPALHGVVVALLPLAEALADADLEVEWNTLGTRASEPNAFAERWYCEAAINAIDDANVRLLIVRDEALIGVVPLVWQGRYAGLPIAHVQNWLNHNAFLGTPLVRQRCESQFWSALLNWLDAFNAGATFLHLAGLNDSGPVAQSLLANCAATGRRYAQVHNEQRALLERGLSPEAYLEATMRGKKRKELRRQQNRLAELGQLEFQRSDGREGLDGWIEEFLALERRGWKGANGSALDCADSTRSLFRGALHGAASKGKLELLALRLDGRAIAMLVNFLTPPGAFSFKTAFDEDYSRFSPGVLLQIHNLTLLERDGIEWCDSCAAQDHPMIDSIWSGRRAIGRYSVAIGGPLRRAAFAALLFAEKAKGRLRQINAGKSKEANGMSS